MKKVIFVAGAVGVIVVLAVVWLRAAPTIGATTATPSVIAVDTPTQVTITAQITDSTFLPGGANLLRVDAAGKTLANLGVMYDDGTNGDAVRGDKIFSYRLTLSEPTVGQSDYRVSAAFKGVLRRTMSPPIIVSVVSHPAEVLLSTVADTLGQGDINAVLTHVSSPSQRDREALSALDAAARAAFASALRNAVLKSANSTLRVYTIPFREPDGTISNVEISLTMRPDGTWFVLTW